MQCYIGTMEKWVEICDLLSVMNGFCVGDLES